MVMLEVFLSNYKPTTEYGYRKIVGDWELFLAPLGILDATEADAWRYCSHLKKRKGMKSRITTDESYSPRSIRNNLMCLRKYYKFLKGCKQIQTNPFDNPDLFHIAKNKTSKREYNPLPYEHVQSVIEAGSSATARTLLSLLFYNGLRISEAVGLKVCDVAINNKGEAYLTLRNTKTNRDQICPLNPHIYELLQSEVKGKPLHEHIFLGSTGKPMLRKRGYELFQQACNTVGLTGYSPHCARVTSICKLLSDGHKHKEVQEFSRHSSIAMVELYDRRIMHIEHHLAKKICY